MNDLSLPKPLILLIALAAGVSYLMLRWLTTPPAPQSYVAGTRPDYTLSNFRLMATDTAGQRSFQIIAPYMWKSPVDGVATVESPDILLFRPDNKQWTGEAARAWITPDSSTVRLSEEVVLKRHAISEEHVPEVELTITTSQMTIYPEQEKARSDAAVVITTPGAELHGNGMNLELNRDYFEMLADVRGTYESQN